MNRPYGYLQSPLELEWADWSRRVERLCSIIYFFCQEAGVVSGQSFSKGSFSSLDQAIHDPS